MILRSEQAEDFEAVDELHRAAFGQPEEAEIVARLRSSEAFIPGLSIVADDDGAIVGHILFTRVRLDPPTPVRVISLAPMAVLPARQRTGVGSALVRHGIDVATGLGEEVVVVVGHPEYYPRFGFERGASFALSLPFRVPGPAFLARALRADVTIPSGRVVYPPEFGDV